MCLSGVGDSAWVLAPFFIVELKALGKIKIKSTLLTLNWRVFEEANNNFDSLPHF